MKIVDQDAFQKAKKLGANFKEGFPATYTRTQTSPTYRVSKGAQKKELWRMFYTTKALGHPMTIGMCYSQLRKKYAKVGMKFLPKAPKPA